MTGSQHHPLCTSPLVKGCLQCSSVLAGHEVESKRGSVVKCHVYEDGEPANQCMDNSRMAQPGPSFIPLSVCAHLLQEGCLRGAAEKV